MQITIYTADCCGNPKNCVYPHAETASTEEEFKRLIAKDHIFASMKGGRRSAANFIGASAIAADIDNDHTDDPLLWIYPEDIPGNFPDVACVTYTSRNHNRPKGDRSARPRLHVVFPINAAATTEAYDALMRRLQAYCTVIDGNATDPARFFFGNPDTEVHFHAGSKTLDVFLDELDRLEEQEFAAWDAQHSSEPLTQPIPEGNRNETMHRIAVKLLKRFGAAKEARTAYLEAADRCSPPLPESELDSIWNSACKFYGSVISKQPGYVSPDQYGAQKDPVWGPPRSLDASPVPEFPVHALPPVLADLVNAVAECVQAPRGMVASAVLAILSVCLQGKYKVQAKPGWTEPVNLYVYNVLSASERKSAVLNFLIDPVVEYENRYNRDHAVEIESSRRTGNALEKSISNIEDQLAKGKATQADLDRAIQKSQAHEVKNRLKLFSDNITMEKLGSVMAANHGRASILTTEPGIFDIMAGAYSDTVNFDLILKAFSGDPSRTERIGREEERLDHPTLTMLLMGQPCTLEALMGNKKFKGRGVTSRFLYCIPESLVGSRRYETEEIPAAVFRAYENLLQNLLTDFYPGNPGNPPVITLSPEALRLHREFYEQVEHLQGTEFEYDAGMKEWAGKLAGNVLRIAALLTRAQADFPYPSILDPFYDSEDDYLYDNTDKSVYTSASASLVVDGNTMRNAISIGRYYLDNARKAFSLMDSNQLNADCKYVRDRILEKRYVSFTSREIFRDCQRFTRMDEILPVLQQLADLEYLAPQEVVYSGKGRPQAGAWLVNPLLYEQPVSAGAPSAA